MNTGDYTLWNVSQPFSNRRIYDAEQTLRRVWFDFIAPKDNWKNPIATWIPKLYFDQCNQACIWFTGAKLTIENESFGMIWVISPGYYATVGS